MARKNKVALAIQELAWLTQPPCAVLPQNSNTEGQAETEPCQSCDAPEKSKTTAHKHVGTQTNTRCCMAIDMTEHLALVKSLKMAPSWPVLPLALGLTFPGHLVVDSLSFPKSI